MERKIGIMSFSFDPDVNNIFPFTVKYARFPNVQVIREVHLMRHQVPQSVLDTMEAAAQEVIDIAAHLELSEIEPANTLVTPLEPRD